MRNRMDWRLGCQSRGKPSKRRLGDPEITRSLGDYINSTAFAERIRRHTDGATGIDVIVVEGTDNLNDIVVVAAFVGAQKRNSAVGAMDAEVADRTPFRAAYDEDYEQHHGRIGKR